MMSNHCHDLVPKHFRHTKGNLAPVEQSRPLSPIPQPPVTIDRPGFSMDSPILDTSCKQKHQICGLLHPVSFTQHNVFKIHPCVGVSFLCMAE